MNDINGHAPRIAVDAANRAVIATISGCRDDVQNELFRACQLSIYYPAVPPRHRARMQLNDFYRSVARCSPEDEFDPDAGARLALARLRKKYWEKYARRMAYAADWLGAFTAGFRRMAADATETAAAIDPIAELHPAPAQAESAGTESAETPDTDPATNETKAADPEGAKEAEV